MALHHNKYIKKLYINTELITIEMLDAIYEMLKVNKNITDIYFGDGINIFDISKQDAQAIGQKLERNRQLLAERVNEIENIGGMLMHSEVKISQNVINEFLQFSKDMLI